jgi:hypothetical protein
MPKITDHQSSSTTKMLYIGDTGAGKTGSLASLAAAGYKLRVIDFDNGLDILRSYLTNPSSPYVKQNPTCAENVDFVTCTDRMKNINGQLYPQEARAWAKAMNLLADWQEKDAEGKVIVKHGPLVSWGPETILVIDSLSMASQSAMNYHLAMNQALQQPRSGYTAQRDVGEAQKLIRKLLMMLYDSSVKCNVLVLAHIKFQNEITVRSTQESSSGEDSKSTSQTFGTPQGYPNTIGSALGPEIGRWFNSLLIARTLGDRHRIFTKVQNVGGIVVNAKTSAPLAVKSDYPLETGLADYFKAVRGEKT